MSQLEEDLTGGASASIEDHAAAIESGSIPGEIATDEEISDEEGIRSSSGIRTDASQVYSSSFERSTSGSRGRSGVTSASAAAPVEDDEDAQSVLSEITNISDEGEEQIFGAQSGGTALADPLVSASLARPGQQGVAKGEESYSSSFMSSTERPSPLQVPPPSSSSAAAASGSKAGVSFKPDSSASEITMMRRGGGGGVEDDEEIFGESERLARSQAQAAKEAEAERRRMREATTALLEAGKEADASASQSAIDSSILSPHAGSSMAESAIPLSAAARFAAVTQPVGLHSPTMPPSEVSKMEAEAAAAKEAEAKEAAAKSRGGPQGGGGGEGRKGGRRGGRRSGESGGRSREGCRGCREGASPKQPPSPAASIPGSVAESIASEVEDFGASDAEGSGQEVTWRGSCGIALLDAWT